jgi:hypothetical protein
MGIAAIVGLLAASSHWSRVFSSLKLRIGKLAWMSYSHPSDFFEPILIYSY